MSMSNTSRSGCGVVGGRAGPAADDQRRPGPSPAEPDHLHDLRRDLGHLVLQGLTLPWLIHRLEELAAEEWTRDDTVERMRGLYQFRHRRLKARGGYLDDDGPEDRSLAYQRLVRELLEAQRREIVLLRNQGEISNQVMHRIERDLDLEDARLEI
jgi:hypothetical protein